MTDILNVRLHGQDVGEIIRLSSGRIQFEFDPGYIDRSNRPTLSQSFMDGRGDIVGGGRPTTSGEVPPFFSNLLPEGRLRTYLANRAGVRETREFELLELVGLDLSGAVDVTREGSDVARFRDCWEEGAKSLPVNDALKRAIDHQLKTVPAITGARRVRRRRPKGGRLD